MKEEKAMKEKTNFGCGRHYVCKLNVFGTHAFARN